MRESKGGTWDFPGGPVVKTSPSRAGTAGLIPTREAKIPRALQPKSQNLSTSKKTQNLKKRLTQTESKGQQGGTWGQKERRLPVGLEAAMRGHDGPGSNRTIPRVSAGEECGFCRPAGFGDGQHGCVYQSGCVSFVTNSPQITSFSIVSARAVPRARLCVVTWEPWLLSFCAPLAFNTSPPRSPWPHPAGPGHRG